jgi:rhodanese-related sulfurtransferase
MVTRLDAATVRTMLAGDVVLLDVLPSDIYLAEHLPGATNLPLESLDRRAVEALDPDKPTILYCFDQH